MPRAARPGSAIAHVAGAVRPAAWPCASAGKTPRATPCECARRSAARATYPRSPRPRPPDAAMRPGRPGPAADAPGHTSKSVEPARLHCSTLSLPTMQQTTLASTPDTGFFGHPRGLSTLFFTEMWERFSYYGMRAFLILYMVAPVTAGGLGFSDADAASIYGTYTASAWGLAILGGIVADRFLGQYRSVLIGGIIIALGHVTLAFPPVPFFYAGLALVAIGTGLLKPNVSTLVGSLYEQADARRDAGFSLFYMGINIGAIAGPLIAGYLAQRVDWHIGFGCAAVGMVLGLLQYVLGKKRLQP